MAAPFNIVANLQLQAPSNLQSVVTTIQRQLSGIKATIDIQVNAQSIQALTGVNVQLKALQNNLQVIASQATTTASALNQINTSYNNANRSASAANTTFNSSASAMQTVQTSAKEGAMSLENFGIQAGLAARRYTAFLVAGGGIVTFAQQMREGLREAMNFQREMVRLSQIGSESMGSLRGLESTVTKLSTTWGVSSEELIHATVQLRQAGLSANDTKLALDSLAKASLGPSFGSMTDTTEGLISALNQFKLSAKDAEGILGSINAVSTKFAVSSHDMIDAIRRTGGAFHAAGGNLNELIALFGAVRSTSRESAESIGSSMRTILARMERPTFVENMRNLNIELTRTRREAAAMGDLGLTGQFVGPYEAVKRIADAVKGLRTTDLRFGQIAEELGGYRQISKTIPLLQEFAKAQQIYQTAQSGSNSLTDTASKAQEAFSVRITKVKEEFSSLIRTITESAGFGTFLDMMLRLASAATTLAAALTPLIPALTIIAAFKIGQGLPSLAGGFVSGLRGASPKFAAGGVVPGYGNGDTVPAMLTPGEFVIKKSSAQSIGYGNLHNINRYAEGGNVNVPFNPADGIGFVAPGDESKGREGTYSIPGSRLNKELATRLGNRRISGPVSTLVMPQHMSDIPKELIKTDAVEAIKQSFSRHIPGFEPSDFYMDKDKNALDTISGHIFEHYIRSFGGFGMGGTGRESFDLLSGSHFSGKGEKFAKLLSPQSLVNKVTFLDAKNSINDRYPSDMLVKYINYQERHGVKGFASGGSVDTVPAMLTPGEFVINKQSAQAIGLGNLRKMNAGGALPQHFAFGGNVGANSFWDSEDPVYHPNNPSPPMTTFGRWMGMGYGSPIGPPVPPPNGPLMGYGPARPDAHAYMGSAGGAFDSNLSTLHGRVVGAIEGRGGIGNLSTQTQQLIAQEQLAKLTAERVEVVKKELKEANKGMEATEATIKAQEIVREETKKSAALASKKGGLLGAAFGGTDADGNVSGAVAPLTRRQRITNRLKTRGSFAGLIGAGYGLELLDKGAGTAEEAVRGGTSGSYSSFKTVGGALSGALAGGAIGSSLLPGWGTVAGAGIGAIVGGLSGNTGANDDLGRVRAETASNVLSARLAGGTQDSHAFDESNNIYREQLAQRASLGGGGGGFLSSLGQLSYAPRRWAGLSTGNMSMSTSVEEQENARRIAVGNTGEARANNLLSQYRQFRSTNPNMSEDDSRMSFRLSHGRELDMLGREGQQSFWQNRVAGDAQQRAGASGAVQAAMIVQNFEALAQAVRSATSGLSEMAQGAHVSAALFDGHISAFQHENMALGLNELGSPDSTNFRSSLSNIGGVFGGAGNGFVNTGNALNDIRGSMMEHIGTLTQPGLTGEAVQNRFMSQIGGAGAGNPMAAQIMAMVKNNLASTIGASQESLGRIAPEIALNPEKFVDKLLAGVPEQLKAKGNEIGVALQQAANAFSGAVATFHQQMQQVGLMTDKQVQIETRAARTAAIMGGESRGISAETTVLGMPMGQLRGGLEFSQQRLAARGGVGAGNAFNPNALGEALSSANDAVRAQRERMNNLKPGADMAKESQLFGELNAQAASLHQALQQLTDVTRNAAAAEEKLNILKKDENSRLSIAEKLMTGDISSRNALIRGQNLAERVSREGPGVIAAGPMARDFFNAANANPDFIHANGMANRDLARQVAQNFAGPNPNAGAMAGLRNDINAAGQIGAQAQGVLANEGARQAGAGLEIAIKGNTEIQTKLAANMVALNEQLTRIFAAQANFIGPPDPGPPAPGHALGGSIFGQPRGTDTVPAWLTPGEFVVNKHSAQANLALLHHINNARYFAEGGNVPWGLDERNPRLPRNLVELPETRVPVFSVHRGRGGPFAEDYGERVANHHADSFEALVSRASPMMERDVNNPLAALAAMNQVAGRQASYSIAGSLSSSIANQASRLGIGMHRPGMSDQLNWSSSTAAGIGFGSNQLNKFGHEWDRTRPMGQFSQFRLGSGSARAFARGGYVVGNGGVDTTPALLSAGEFVLNARATSNLGVHNAQALNSGGTAYYADGGSVTTPVAPPAQAQQGAGAGSGGFSSSVSILQSAFGNFATSVNNLLAAITKIPPSISLTGTHSVNVNIHGSEAFAQLQDSMTQMVTRQINYAINEFIGQKFPEVGPMPGVSIPGDTSEIVQS